MVTARQLPTTQAEAQALIRLLQGAMGHTLDQPASDLEIIAAHATNPWIISEYIDEANVLTIPASSDFVRILSFRVPANQLGIIDGFTNGVTSPSQFDQVTWQLRVNDAAVPGYDLIQGPIGFFPDVIQTMFYPLFQNNKVEVWANNIATIPQVHVAAKIKGRTFPNVIPAWLSPSRAASAKA